jgi:RNase P/RNase MRP subunit p29
MNVIGEQLRVVGSSDPTKVGKAGKVLMETANTLLVDSNGKAVRLEKEGSTFLLASGEVVNGADLAGRMQDRLGRGSR